ncbi:MAG TPA: serine/threonine-protein kinase [Gemmatimonadaceae bacterium]|nr:serine/threonine-protein kinase [Gemmatimonadaceae bacterium]
MTLLSTLPVTNAAPPPSTPKPIVPDQVLGERYRVQRQVGEGGMSVVYLALDTVTGERVAVKALSSELSSDTTAMARLKREARLGERLKHPCACSITALGETDDGLMYVVMPFLDGEILCDRTARMRQIPLAETVALVRDIADGLHAAHSVGIIHRDLKPENVMVCAKPDGGERAVVMDFGLAKQHRPGADIEKLTMTGVVLGTPEFMSPEQLRGRTLDARTDIYSLAVMTFEMLTGVLPFIGRTKQDTMLTRLQGQTQRLRHVRPELGFPQAVEEVLAKGMSVDRNKRYRTAPDFATALTAAADGGPVDGTPSSGSAGGVPWWKRLFE